MKVENIKGYAYGIVASVSYGLNPLFALPLYDTGIKVYSVLFYRYILAIVAMAFIMKLTGMSFKINRKECITLFIFGIFFSLSSLFLFQSFNYMDAGIASTILFVYPVLVALIMSVFYKEHLGKAKMCAIGLALAGISLLYHGEGGVTLNLTGVGLVLASSLTYALYIVGMNHSVLKGMPGLKLTFYAVLFGSSVYFIALRGGVDLQVLTTSSQWINAIGLALFPSVLSMVTIAKSIQHIGATSAAILGALEPLTALAVGVVIFGEHLTHGNAFGILLILTAVTLIVAYNKKAC